MHYTNTALTSALAGVRDNRLVALAMSSRRSAVLPNVPTIAEAGYPEALYASWVGMVVSSKTPRDIINRLNRSVASFLKRPDIQERLRNDGREGISTTPEETAQMLASEIATWVKVVKVANIRIN